MDKDGSPTFHAAIRDIITLTKLVERLKDDEMQPVVLAVKRQLLDLPSTRGKDRSVTRSDVLRDLEELIALVGEYHYDKIMNLNNLERMFFRRSSGSDERAAWGGHLYLSRGKLLSWL